MIEYRSNVSIEKLRFSEDFIDRWSKFIRFGHAWKTLNDGWILNIEQNQSALERFQLPSTVDFWLKSTSIALSSTLTIVVTTVLLSFSRKTFSD